MYLCPWAVGKSGGAVYNATASIAVNPPVSGQMKRKLFNNYWMEAMVFNDYLEDGMQPFHK